MGRTANEVATRTAIAIVTEVTETEVTEVTVIGKEENGAIEIAIATATATGRPTATGAKVTVVTEKEADETEETEIEMTIGVTGGVTGKEAIEQEVRGGGAAAKMERGMSGGAEVKMERGMTGGVIGQGRREGGAKVTTALQSQIPQNVKRAGGTAKQKKEAF